MKIVRYFFLVVFLIVMPAFGVEAAARGTHMNNDGAYLVVEGNVTSITARTLVIDGKPYPVSMFARVFNGDLKGQEMPLYVVVNVGRINQAKLYILRGKVEKIVVIKNL